MAVNAGPPLLLLILTGVALLVGLWLLWRGWRGKRVGDAPYCATCGYSLVGASSDRCPECGADIGRGCGVVYGRRVRRRGTLAVGAAVVVIAGLFLLGAGSDRVRNFDWYTLKPTGYVLDDLANPRSPDRDRAWRELTRRQKAGGRLSARNHDRLVGIALSEQGAATPAGALTRDLVEWLGDEALAERLGDTQKRQFFEQAMRLALAVRPRVIDGDDVPFRVTHQGRGPNGSGVGWWNRIETVSASVDGAPLQLVDSGGSFSGVGSGASVRASIPARGIGRHELRVTVRVEVWSGPEVALVTSKRNTRRHVRDVTMTQAFEVVPDVPENRPARRAPEPGDEARLRGAIAPEDFKFETTPRPALAGAISLQSLPFDVSFTVAARVGGAEYPLGVIVQPAGRASRYRLRGDYDGPPGVTAVDLILRPDEKAARRSEEEIRFWDGTLQFKGVPVKAATR